MIECPQCWTKFKGPKCSCGYSSAQNRETFSHDHAKAIREIERAKTEEAKRWNDWNAGTKGSSGEARKAALLAYYKRLNTETRAVTNEPRLWALKVLSRHADGEVLPALVVRMAREASGVTE